MAGRWQIRRYIDADASQLRSFTCSTPGQRWTKPPQKIIRAAPDAEECPSVFVAEDLKTDKGRILGVIVFDLEQPYIHSVGVVRDRRREGIGSSLKRASLAEMVALVGTVTAVSSVHKKNIPMIKLNEGLGVKSTKDPEDGDYLLSAILVEPTPDTVTTSSTPLIRALLRRFRTREQVN